MTEPKVLSKEEVDALLNLTQDTNVGALGKDHSTSVDEWSESVTESSINKKALNNIAELTASEYEKALITFLRRKINVNFKGSRFGTLKDCIGENVEKHVFCVFQILPFKHYGMGSVDLPFIHHAINLLYGGQYNPKEPIMETPGKIGTLIAQKICEIALQCFTQASTDYGTVNFEMVKSILAPNLTSKISLDDPVCSIELLVNLGEVETILNVMMSESFIREFVPHKDVDNKHVESNFWRTAIETQVADSKVVISATLPDVSLKISELRALQAGDVIPIGDPTLVYICLNNLKLFRASAGQANSKRVVKVISEV